MEATERLEQRILLALLRSPRPLNWFGNTLQRKVLADLRHRGLVRQVHGRGPNGTPDERLLMLTMTGRIVAREIEDERRERWRIRQLKRRPP